VRCIPLRPLSRAGARGAYFPYLITPGCHPNLPNRCCRNTEFSLTACEPKGMRADFRDRNQGYDRKSWRAITSRCISLVPSAIVQILASR
jgi:hypothetical protein